MKQTLSRASARRIALAAQGFGSLNRDGGSTQRHLASVLKHTGLLQIDSVSAVVRAHYMPVFSRIGSYPMNLVEEAASRRPRRLFEYWAHEASFLPVETWPLLQWRMANARAHRGIYKGLARFAQEKSGFVAGILDRVARDGPIAASAIEGHKGQGGWWGWSEAKHAFEWLFWAGLITTSSRRGFERLYDLPERVIPRGIYDLPAMAPDDAVRDLLRISARALGVATAADLRDYFRLKPDEADGRILELVETGELLSVRIEGWSQKAFLWNGARMPRKVDARALLCPFDPVVWERGRAERLFDFRYRIEIYTPADKRVHGYYVLPFLFGETIAARVDLKAERSSGTLRVHAAYAEPHAPPGTVEALAGELSLMQQWLGLDRVEVQPKGDIAPALAEAISRS